MAQTTLTVNVQLRWWVLPYLRTLGFLCLMMRTEPNVDKLMRMIPRFIKVVPTK